MTRSQLIAAVAQQTALPAAQVERTVDVLVDTVITSLERGDKVTIAGFGRFEMRPRKTKAYTNPKTGVSTKLAPHPRLQGQRPDEAPPGAEVKQKKGALQIFHSATRPSFCCAHCAGAAGRV